MPTESNSFYERGSHPWKRNTLTWILRVIVGSVFIFSGLTKGIDPWGTIYKFHDYLSVMSIDIWQNLVLVGAFGLCGVEFLTGVFLLLGCFRRSSAVLAGIIVILMMLPLTLWIAVSNPVADCGCFGDAIIISNWATFWKNVALTPCILWLIKFNKQCHWVITPALQWLAFVVTGFFIVCVELIGYISQPLLDFRPYKIGSPIIEESAIASNNPNFKFIYEKNGESKEFGINDELPDEEDGWTFVERREINPIPSDVKENGDKTLRIWSVDGEEDITEDVITTSGKELIIMMPDLSQVSLATTWKLNSLHEWSLENDVDMIAVVSGSIEEIETWADLSMASYPIFIADDTQLKAVVRGNPGVVYLVDGIIIWKSTLRAINVDDFLSPETSRDAANFSIDNSVMLRNLSLLYISVMAVLIVMSFIPYLRRFFKNPQMDQQTESSHS